MTIWTKSFWKAWAERVLWTLVQIVVGFGLAWVKNDFSFEGWNWKDTLSGLIFSTVGAMIKGVSANAITKTGPSSGQSEQVVPPLPAPQES